MNRYSLAGLLVEPGRQAEQQAVVPGGRGRAGEQRARRVRVRAAHPARRLRQPQRAAQRRRLGRALPATTSFTARIVIKVLSQIDEGQSKMGNCGYPLEKNYQSTCRRMKARKMSNGLSLEVCGRRGRVAPPWELRGESFIAVF